MAVKSKILNKERVRPEKVDFISRYNPKKDLLAQIMVPEIKDQLPNFLLMKVDKSTMAQSVEARVPFLDHRLVELSIKIPTSMKLRDGTEKYIFRRAIANILPKSITERRKHAFIVPWNEWIKKKLNDYIPHIVDEATVRSSNLFNWKMVQAVSEYAYKTDNVPKYDMKFNRGMLMFFFMIWYKMFIEGRKPRFDKLCD